VTEQTTKYGVDLGKENTSVQAEVVSSKLQENFINTNTSSQGKSTEELTTQTDVEEGETFNAWMNVFLHLYLHSRRVPEV